MSQNGVRTLLKLRIPSSVLKKEYADRYLDDLVKRVKNGVTIDGTLRELSREAKIFCCRDGTQHLPIRMC